jgi:hypothetical protein
MMLLTLTDTRSWPENPGHRPPLAVFFNETRMSMNSRPAAQHVAAFSAIIIRKGAHYEVFSAFSIGCRAVSSALGVCST